MKKMTPAEAGMFRAICGPLSANQRTVAERAWRARTVAAKPQKPCDKGLFGQDHLQADLELSHEPQ